MTKPEEGQWAGETSRKVSLDRSSVRVKACVSPRKSLGFFVDQKDWLSAQLTEMLQRVKRDHEQVLDGSLLRARSGLNTTLNANERTASPLRDSALATLR